jgi:hypothetical protein
MSDNKTSALLYQLAELKLFPLQTPKQNAYRDIPDNEITEQRAQCRRDIRAMLVRRIPQNNIVPLARKQTPPEEGRGETPFRAHEPWLSRLTPYEPPWRFAYGWLGIAAVAATHEFRPTAWQQKVSAPAAALANARQRVTAARQHVAAAAPAAATALASIVPGAAQTPNRSRRLSGTAAVFGGTQQGQGRGRRVAGTAGSRRLRLWPAGRPGH